MQIKKIGLKDINQATQLHYNSLQDISANLGINYVKKLYRILLEDDGFHHSYGAFVGKKMVGLMIITSNLKNTQQLLHKLVDLDFFSTLLVKLLKMQISPIRIIKRFFYERKLGRMLKGDLSGIIIICIDKGWQHRGVGSQLIKNHFNLAKKMGIKITYVDTRGDNINAIEFYKHNGFKQFAKFYGFIVFKCTL